MLNPPVAADHRAARRRSWLAAPAATLAAAAVTATALTAVVVPVAGATTPPSENAAAASAVTALAEGATDIGELPADFAGLFGYTPALAGGVLVKPTGECSSPVPLPAEFETACKAHDLGYDLLRYARIREQPLGAWARRTIDASLDRAMRESCTTRAATVARARCTTMAAVASVFVDLNSRREGYGSPVIGPLGDRAGQVTR